MIVESKEIQELQNKLDNIKKVLDEEQRIFFSLNSIQNFLNSYNKLSHFEDKVYTLLVDYFSAMKDYDYSIDRETSTKIGKEYVIRIGTFYAAQLGFKLRLRFDIAIFYGILIDLLLLVFGVLQKVYYLPIATCTILIYWMYLRVFYEKRNKVFAIRY